MSGQMHWCQHKAGSPKKAESPAMDQCCQKELMVNELCVCTDFHSASADPALHLCAIPTCCLVSGADLQPCFQEGRLFGLWRGIVAALDVVMTLFTVGLCRDCCIV